MRRELPGAAKYYRPFVVSLPCSVLDCVEPAHAGYRTATGHQFCMSHMHHFLLVELAQRLCHDDMTSRGVIKQSRLDEWMDLAINGDGEIVRQRLEAHKEDCARWKIDDRIL